MSLEKQLIVDNETVISAKLLNDMQDAIIDNESQIELSKNKLNNVSVENLLDNSDFRNPVNRRGQTSYTGPVYGIDKWMANANDNVVTIHDEYVSYKNTGTPNAFRQVIANASRFVGKTLTLAFECQMEESVICRATIGFVNASGTAISSHNGSNVTNVRGVSVVSVTVPEGTEYIYAQMNVRIAGGTVRMYWAALYEGAYTAETLPPYVPKGYAGELLACKVADTGGIDADTLGGKAPEYYLSPKNYLDNGYFLNPVNQRGSTELTQSGTYPVDRWVFLHTSGTTGKATVSAAGITITKSDDAEYCDLYQKIANPEELVGKQITFAVKFAGYDTPLVLNAPFGNGNYNAHYGVGEIRIFTYNNLYAYIRLRNIGTSMTVEWAALYEGTYPPENLPPYVPKGYAAELLTCNIAETGRVHDSDKLDGKEASLYLNKNDNDYIVDQGTSGIWGYRKWNSGLAECWFFVQHQVDSFEKAWGSLYESDEYFPTYDFPFHIYSIKSEAICPTAGLGIITAQRARNESAQASPPLIFMRPMNTTSGCKVRVGYYMIGTWKE